MKQSINAAVIGLGNRGYSVMKQCILKMDDVKIVAVCDKYEDRTNEAAKTVKSACGTAPLATQNYKDLLELKLDAVFVMTSWEAHVEIALEFMQRGVYVAMEVGGAYTIDDCYKLVDTYKRTGTPCMLLENCCYNEAELAVLNAVRQGIFGEVVHCEGGYMHDLREEISFGKENRHYRLNNYLTRNCENYATHEIGPISKVLNINRGNRFVSLVSVASKAAGLNEYARKNPKVDRALVDAKWAQGDVISTVLTCEDGATVTIFLDTTLPRPYSRHFTVRGTRAMYSEDGNYFFIDGIHSRLHASQRLLWGNGRRFARKFAHPITKIKCKSVLHGNMDWRVARAFVEAVKLGEDTPIDVYDCATWMAITALSEQSIKTRSIVDFPDFTDGAYKNRVCELKNTFKLD